MFYKPENLPLNTTPLQKTSETHIVYIMFSLLLSCPPMDAPRRYTSPPVPPGNSCYASKHGVRGEGRIITRYWLYVYPSIHPFIHPSIHPFIHHIYIYTHSHTSTLIHTHPHTSTHTHIYIYIYIYICIYIHTFMHTHIHTYTHTYIHTYIHTHTHTYTHTHIHTHIHTYIHTHTHTNTHTHTQRHFITIYKCKHVYYIKKYSPSIPLYFINLKT